MTRGYMTNQPMRSVLRGAEKGNARAGRRRQEEIDRAAAALALPPVRDFVGELEARIRKEAP